MKKFLNKYWQRIVCFFKGHSHPIFICYYCGALPRLEFATDKDGNSLLDEKGKPYYIWVGTRYK